MVEIISGTDRIIQWYRVKLGSNTASLVFYHARLIFSAGLTLTEVCQNSLSRTNENISPLLGSGEYSTGSHLYLVRDNEVIDSLDTDDTPLSVTGQSNPLPPNTTALSSFRPGDERPRRVSRKYWPFIRSDFLNENGNLTVNAQATIQAVAELYLDTQDWGGSGFSARTRVGFSGQWPDPGELFFSVKTSPLIATQRRRIRGSQKAAWEN